MTVEIMSGEPVAGRSGAENTSPEIPAAHKEAAQTAEEKPAVFISGSCLPRRRAKTEKGGGFVLIMQLLVCAIIVGAYIAAKSAGGAAADIAGQIISAFR